MKYIFLDLDGVCNSSVFFREYLREQDMDTEILVCSHPLLIDPKVVKLLNNLVEKSGAQVIFSSTWRDRFPPDHITRIFKDSGATFSITGRTPDLSEGGVKVPRGNEVEAFLYSLPEAPESFVILDDKDDSDFLQLKNNLVLTNTNCGLTFADAERALQILNGV
jgi:hypothetical protein